MSCIANRVQGPDGRWRTLDSRALHKAAVAMSERYDTVLADLITARLGLDWEYRERGPRGNPAYELAAVPPSWSSCSPAARRRSRPRPTGWWRHTTATTAARPDRGDGAWRCGSRPPCRPGHPRSATPSSELTDQWHRRATAALGERRRGVGPRRRWPPGAGHRAASRRTRAIVDRVADEVLTVLTAKRATWTAWNAEAETHRALKAQRLDRPGGPRPAHRAWSCGGAPSGRCC